ncbi:hypothetical protein [Natronocalculus amylovorans]|uniref:DUF8130 domain-containing protein n=1 Tax=Natronocalculus amylovorans TaxID=2917812 RepID=A0AAE3KBU6_9EURY|nr:hypothetical protein [Natronocalculus amylovorans]MCL9817574.1 hypothetical protein [Natronocalculus amylovorans]
MPHNCSRRRVFLQVGGCLGVASLTGCIDRTLRRLENIPEPLEGPHLLTIEEVTEESDSDELPVELSYEVDDRRIAEDDPARLSISLKNTSDQTLMLRANGPPWPFGVRMLLPEDGHDNDDGLEPVTMWTDTYEETDEVTTTRHREVRSASDRHVHEELSGGESVTENYRLYLDSAYLSVGIYRMTVAARVDGGVTEGSRRIDFDKITIESE